MTDLLRHPLVTASLASGGVINLALPGVLAALVRDEVSSFPSLRAHQVPAWHMFLVQLGAIAMHRAGLTTPPTEEAEWLRIVRALAMTEFPNDEPWRLVVEDRGKPAFMQPPVPADMVLGGEATTPDALDMLITSRNHELKSAIAETATPQDWVFALVSLQTCEGYGGRGNNGIARMNGGSSSRVCFSLAPMSSTGAAGLTVRPGARLLRDLVQLQSRRAEWFSAYSALYTRPNGSALLWTLPWIEGDSLPLQSLDPLFIEVCRRVRLTVSAGRMTACTGTSDAIRADGKKHKGAIGDPWSPVHATENKSLTLGDSGDFDFETMSDLLFSGDWKLPLLATLGAGETDIADAWVIIAQAFARGNSKTGGFKERIIPVRGKVLRSMRGERPALHTLARNQIEEIETFLKMLRDAIAIGAVGGDASKIKRETYAVADLPRASLNRFADRIFFDALWARFDAIGNDAATSATRRAFLRQLDASARELLEDAISSLPCRSLDRPRAEARARSQYFIQRAKSAVLKGVDFGADQEAAA